MVETLEVLQRTLARRRPVGPPRSPHGRAHGLPDPCAVAGAGEAWTAPGRGPARRRRRGARPRAPRSAVTGSGSSPACSWAGVAVGIVVGIHFVPRIVTAFGRARTSAAWWSAVRCSCWRAPRRPGLGLAVGAACPDPPCAALPVRIVDRSWRRAIGAVGVLSSLWLLVPILATRRGWLARVARARLGDRRWIEPLRADAAGDARSVAAAGSARPALGARPLQAAARSGHTARHRGSPRRSTRVRASTVQVEGQRATTSRRGVAGSSRLTWSSPTRTWSRARADTVSTTASGVLARPWSSFDPSGTSRCCTFPGLTAPALARMAAERRARLGAVYGHPGGGQSPPRPPGSAARSVAVGPDIYGNTTRPRHVLRPARPAPRRLGRRPRRDQRRGCRGRVRDRPRPLAPLRSADTNCGRPLRGARRPGRRRGCGETAEHGGRADRLRCVGSTFGGLLDFDEDALAGALLGGFDGRFLHPAGTLASTLGATRVGEHLVALLDVGEAVVEQGEDVGAISSHRPSPVQSPGRSTPSCALCLESRGFRGGCGADLPPPEFIKSARTNQGLQRSEGARTCPKRRPRISDAPGLACRRVTPLPPMRVYEARLCRTSAATPPRNAREVQPVRFLTSARPRHRRSRCIPLTR